MRDTLESRLDIIESVFDVDMLLARDTDDANNRTSYYRTNRLAYKVFNDWSGNMHMGISHDGTFNKDDFWGQARLVEEHLPHTDARILELASGRAATVSYLADRHPEHTFVGLDLSYGSVKQPPVKDKNIGLIAGDFQQLPLRPESFTLAYGIEALCYAEDPKNVLEEVYSSLEQGGTLVVFDGYSSVEIDQMTDIEQRASELIYAGMMVTRNGNSYPEFQAGLAESGFDIVQSVDFSQEVMPSVQRLGTLASTFFLIPKIAKRVNKVMPQLLTANAISGYLMPLTVEQGIHKYHMTVARKNTSRSKRLTSV